MMPPSLEPTTQMSASEINPARSAALTASPRLLTRSFLNIFRRCVSTDGTPKSSSFASCFVVCPFAIPRNTCISLYVRDETVADAEGSAVARRITSGIIRLGTGLSLRMAASNACSSSVGPMSLRTYPLQPARIIRTRSSLASDTVHATILSSGCRERTALTVSGPSRSGM
jgi:hypothetical protein